VRIKASAVFSRPDNNQVAERKGLSPKGGRTKNVFLPKQYCNREKILSEVVPPDKCSLMHGVEHMRAKSVTLAINTSILQQLAVLALQLSFQKISESIGNHDSKIVGASSVD
jgi:hypothetical protein